MIFNETKLKDAFYIELNKMEDERGFFARAYCEREFTNIGITSRFVQCNISMNKDSGILRGMHYQTAPYEEDKLIRCTRGSIYDVIIDLRKESNTFKQWYGVELSSDKHNMLYIPKGFAHGFLTLENNTEAFYQMGEFFNPESARGLRWNDPSINIEWPFEPKIISERDKNYPDFNH